MMADSDWACTTAFPSVTFLSDEKQSQQTGNELITPGRQASTAVFRKKDHPSMLKKHTHTHTHFTQSWKAFMCTVPKSEPQGEDFVEVGH